MNRITKYFYWFLFYNIILSIAFTFFFAIILIFISPSDGEFAPFGNYGWIIFIPIIGYLESGIIFIILDKLKKVSFFHKILYGFASWIVCILILVLLALIDEGDFIGLYYRYFRYF